MGVAAVRLFLGLVVSFGVYGFLHVFMPLPGGAYIGTQWRKSTVTAIFSNHPFIASIAPISIANKYLDASLVVGQGIAWLHAIPCGVWSLFAPLQLTKAGLRFLALRMHKVAGRTMLSLAAISMVVFVDFGDIWVQIAC